MHTETIEVGDRVFGEKLTEAATGMSSVDDGHGGFIIRSTGEGFYKMDFEGLVKKIDGDILTVQEGAGFTYNVRTKHVTKTEKAEKK